MPAGWRPALILIAVALVDRIETSVVAGVLPLLQDEWGFSDTAGGAIPTASVIAGMLVVIPAGYLADRVPRARLIAMVVASWSLIIAASGIAVSFAMFFATRVVLGAADSMEGSSASSLLSDSYPPASRGRVLGFHRMASLLGGGLGVIVGGVVGDLLGWRWAFLVMIVPGLLVAWLVTTLDEPPRGQIDRLAAEVGQPVDDATPGHPVDAVLDPDLADAHVEAPPGEFRDQVRALLRITTAVRVNAGIAAVFIGLSGLVFWIPSYYERRFGLEESQASLAAAGPFLVAIVVGTVVGGTLGDRWQGVRPGARAQVAGTGLLAGSILLPFAFLVDDFVPHLLVLAPAASLMAAAIPNLSAAMADVVPASFRGIGFGVFGFVVSIGGAIGPLAVGAASDLLGSLQSAFVCLTAPIVIGALVVLSCRAHLDRDVADALAAS